MQDIFFLIPWWLAIFAIGIIFLPLTIYIFEDFLDYGYIFAKTIGIGLLTYLVFVLSITKLLKFDLFTIFFSLLLLAIFNLYLFYKMKNKAKIKKKIPVFFLEEFIFITCLSIWSYIRGFEPSIHNLEKFMDFGFINSILRSTYLPPVDIWFPPHAINYYYFGHLITAVLTKLTLLSSNITFNLMIATLFAFTFTSSFSIITNLFNHNFLKKQLLLIPGLLAGLLTALAGNLQVIYSFFTSYQAENPKPFWELIFSPLSFPNNYWYPNATRFIPFTIHEFPIYSFVVSDLHGHVSDIPFVLLTIALLYSLLISKKIKIQIIMILSLLLSIMYMTNAWDGPIYLGLFCLVLVSHFFVKTKKGKFIGRIKSTFDNYIYHIIKSLVTTVIGFFIFTLPFNINFKPFASGIGVLCAPDFLISRKSFPPFIFEAQHCQRSEFWQLLILYGFFYFFVVSFILFLIKTKTNKTFQDFFIVILIVFSTILIVIPEFFYIKDIYPAHYRANTMFKLVFQAFMMLSLSSAYIISKLTSQTKKRLFIIPSFILLSTVLLFPYFAVNSYYGNLQNRVGFDGTKYLETILPEDYQAIKWINNNINGQPIMLEAQGDSYTDYERISANTGLPTVMGWTVHEWLWRGTYETVAPRVEDARLLYESNDINQTISLIKKYKVSYVYLGKLEKQKYQNLNSEKFNQLGTVIYKNGDTLIYKISN